MRIPAKREGSALTPPGRNQGESPLAPRAAGPSNGLAAPLATVLIAAADAWRHYLDGRALERALALGLGEFTAAATAAPAGAAGAADATAARLRAAVQDVVFTAARERALLLALIARLAARLPEPPVAALLAVALSQLRAGRHGAFTVVDQAVEAARQMPATRAAGGFVNALLRRYGREGEALVAQLQQDPVVRTNLPAWWLARLQADWPRDWSAIVAAQGGGSGSEGGPPPLVLRVNRRIGSPAGQRIEPGAAPARSASPIGPTSPLAPGAPATLSHGAAIDAILAQLALDGVDALRVGADAIWLRRAVPVGAIPGFATGAVSVQDAGSQLAAQWLDPRPGQRVLDACAAPGGKTLHLAECADVRVDALEVDPLRARRIEDNVARVSRGWPDARDRVRIIVADAVDWAQSQAQASAQLHAQPRTDPPAAPIDPGARPSGGPIARYDRILLDAPCTASGIVRRHPDVPWLRRPDDVAELATTQARLLDVLWPLLAPAGRLLYVVCSLFAEEGVHQVERFVARQSDARWVALPGQPAAAPPGRLALLPHYGPVGAAVAGQLPCADLAWTISRTAPFEPAAGIPSIHDGFFFALLEKT
jgi:16S rRNA (cytosine967-C5)-methyltransferase